MKQLTPELAKQLVAPVLALCLAICLFCLGYQCSRKPAEPIEKTETMTVTTTRVDTVWKTKTVTVSKPTPVAKTITRVERDTLLTTQILHDTDTVYTPVAVDVPITTSVYSGEKTLSDSVQVEYQAAVSGYKPALDSLQFHVTYPERTINTSTVTTTTSVKKRHFGIGPSAGIGYGLTSKKFDVFVGLSITYSF